MRVVASFTFPFVLILYCLLRMFFFFNDTAPTKIYTLSLHDALPISNLVRIRGPVDDRSGVVRRPLEHRDRKSTRLNSSHPSISYAVFCLKKKNKYRPTNVRHF